MRARARTCRGLAVLEAITSARLLLRPLGSEPGHRALYGALYGDPGVMQYVAEPVPAARIEESYQASLRASQHAPDFPSRWCAQLRQDGQGVGLVGADRHPDSSSVEVGVLLLPASQGRGYAQEALSALMTALASHPEINGFWSRHHAANLRMARVLEGLRFVRTPGATVWHRWERAAEIGSAGGAPGRSARGAPGRSAR